MFFQERIVTAFGVRIVSAGLFVLLRIWILEHVSVDIRGKAIYYVIKISSSEGMFISLQRRIEIDERSVEC